MCCFSTPISRDFPVHCTYNFYIQCAEACSFINDDMCQVRHTHARSTGPRACEVCAKCAKRATRRFNALFQKANKQLINIFKQRRKTTSRQNRYFFREGKNSHTHTHNGESFSVKVNEMVEKKKRREKVGPIEPLAAAGTKKNSQKWHELKFHVKLCMWCKSMLNE